MMQLRVAAANLLELLLPVGEAHLLRMCRAFTLILQTK